VNVLLCQQQLFLDPRAQDAVRPLLDTPVGGHLRDVPCPEVFSLGEYRRLVERHGCVAVPYRTAADTLDDLSRAIDECLLDDVLVFSGGSSVGERDLILDALAARGEVLFHGIAVKPGKPMAFGRIAGRPFFGLPGYPTSCLTNSYVLLAPALRQMAALPTWSPRLVTMPLGSRIVSTTGRHQFYTVRIEDGIAMPAFKSSGDITSMSRAHGYIEISEHTDIVEQGELVEIRLF